MIWFLAIAVSVLTVGLNCIVAIEMWRGRELKMVAALLALATCWILWTWSVVLWTAL